MRKICASVCLVAAVLAGGPAFAADANAVLRSSNLLPSDGPGDCGPLHNDNAAPPAQTQDTGHGRAERGAYAGNYCDSDAGVPTRPGPQGHENPSTAQSGRTGQTGQNGAGQDTPINPQAGYGAPGGSAGSAPTGGTS